MRAGRRVFILPITIIWLSRLEVVTVTVIHAAGHLVLPVLAIELQTKVREVFTIREKTHTRAFSSLKAPTSHFTFRTL